MTGRGLLNGLRVVECVGWNGVLAGRLLADAGADVVRIVPPYGDALSQEPPFFRGTSVSIQEVWYNAGKRIVELDLETESGREQLLDLLSRADAFIDDWLPTAAPLSEVAIEQCAPGLVRVTVTPMGLYGPGSELLSNDLVANALSGAASVTGDPCGSPLNGYGNQSYHTVGLYTAFCVLAALRAAHATGRSQRVDLSAHEALVSCTEQVLMQWFFPKGGAWDSAIASRQGPKHWSGAYQVCPGADGVPVVVSGALRLADVLLPWLVEEDSAQDLTDQTRYPSVAEIVSDLPHLMMVIKDWARTKPAEELFLEAQHRHQPFAPVWSVREVVEKSPQVHDRGYFQPVDVPEVGPVMLPGRFFRSNVDKPEIAVGTRVSLSDISWGDRSRRNAGDTSKESSLPLAGVRVLDFTHVLAGPFATRLLADLGAQVIKVSTAARASGSAAPDHPYYTSWNRNKQSITINMTTKAGVETARALAHHSDVLIENFSAGLLERWGLEQRTLARESPRTSVVSMGGMGRTGPWRDFVTVAPTIHALTGLTYLTNPPGRHDIGYGFSLTDHLAGIAGAIAVLEALEYRERTGEGVDIDLAQYEVGLGLMAPALMDYVANGRSAEPVGNDHPFQAWAPHGIYRCCGSGAWVAIAVRGDAEWTRLCHAMGKDDLVLDTRFASHERRIAAAENLNAEITDWTSRLDRYEAMAQCQQAGIRAGVVQDAADLATRDEQLRSRGFFTTAHAEPWGDYGIDRFPALFNGRPIENYSGVHPIGADTFAILTGVLEMSADEIAELVIAGALS